MAYNRRHAAAGKAELGAIMCHSADAHTFPAQNATVGIVINERVVTVHLRRSFNGGKRTGSQADVEEAGDGL